MYNQTLSPDFQGTDLYSDSAGHLLIVGNDPLGIRVMVTDLGAQTLWTNLWASNGTTDSGSGIWMGTDGFLFTCGSTDGYGANYIDALLIRWHYSDVPPAPTLLSLSPNTHDNEYITINWTASPGATEYWVYRSAQFITIINSSTTQIASVTSIPLSYIDHVSPSGTFYYAVMAINATGTSPLSNCLTITIPITTSSGTSSTSSSTTQNVSSTENTSTLPAFSISGYPMLLIIFLTLMGVIINARCKLRKSFLPRR